MAEISTLLLYPMLQFAPGIVAKPDGSLSLPYLAGALRDADLPVSILDCAVGRDGDDVGTTFFRRRLQSNGLVWHGMDDQDILRAVAPHNLIGVTSIFTPQTTPTLHLIRLIKAAYPEKLMVAGGVNARALRERFLDAGVDLVCLSEGERTIVDIATAQAAGTGYSAIPGVAVRHNGHTVVTRPAPIEEDLDRLPVPAWALLPNEQYWTIGRPHGGRIAPGTKYAEMQTTRGCIYSCTFCHISKETGESESGAIARYRMKSRDRVLHEADTLKALGVEYVYIEDDSLLAKKARAIAIFRDLASRGLRLADVNGVNLSHLMTNRDGRLVPDVELMSVMVECGFEELSLPFESGSQRIIDRYASRKWTIAKTDTAALIRAALDVGLRVSGNYMLGYPTETMDEVMATLRMATRHVDVGLEEVNVFLVVPFPGSALFDEALANGYLPADWNPDEMRWFAPTMRNTAIAPDHLKLIRDLAWTLLNRPVFVDDRMEAAVSHAR